MYSTKQKRGIWISMISYFFNVRSDVLLLGILSCWQNVQGAAKYVLNYLEYKVHFYLSSSCLCAFTMNGSKSFFISIYMRLLKKTTSTGKSLKLFI